MLTVQPSLHQITNTTHNDLWEVCNGYGILLVNDSCLRNLGTLNTDITFETVQHFEPEGCHAYGLRLESSQLINTSGGSINTKTEAYGVEPLTSGWHTHGLSFGESSSFVNEGYVSTNSHSGVGSKQGDGFAYGIDLNASELINRESGSIDAGARVTFSLSGQAARAYALHLDNGSTLTNSGSIEASANLWAALTTPQYENGPGAAYALYSSASQVNNLTGAELNLTLTTERWNAGQRNLYGVYLVSDSHLHNEGTINIVANQNLEEIVTPESGSTYGIFLNESKLTNASSGNISISGVCGSLMVLQSGSHLKNEGRVEMDVSIGFNDYPQNAFSLSGASILENHSTISLSIDGEATYASAISLTESSRLINNATFDISSNLSFTIGADISYGCSLTNRGDMSLTASSTGINLLGAAQKKSSVLTNGGNLALTVSGTSTYGINMQYAELNNEAGATLSVSAYNSEQGSAKGISLYNSTLTNAHNATLSVSASTMSDATTSSRNVYGIELRTPNQSSSTLTNHGTIEVESHALFKSQDAYGIEVTKGNTLSNNGSIRINSSAAAEDSYVYGLHLLNSISNDTGGQISIFTSGAYESYGIYMGGGTHLSNGSGSSIQTEALASNATSSSALSYGLYMYAGRNSDTSFTNHGTAQFAGRSTGEATAYGIYQENSRAHILNESTGELSALARSENISYGMYLESNTNGVINHGRMNVSSEAVNGSAYGIYQYNSPLYNEQGASIKASTVADNNAYTLYLLGQKAVFNNKGRTELESTSSMNSAYALYMSTSTSLFNSSEGHLTITADAQNKAWGIRMYSSNHITNEGTIEAFVSGNTAGYGIQLSSASYVINYGTMALSVSSDTGGCGIDMAQESSFANYGNLTIQTSGNIAQGIHLSGADTYFSNSGNLKTNKIELGTGTTFYLQYGSSISSLAEDEIMHIGGADGVLSLRGSHVSVNSALSVSGIQLDMAYDVTLSLAGTMSVADDVTLNFNDHTLTIAGGGTLHLADNFGTVAGTLAADADSTVSVGEGVTLTELRGGNLISTGSAAVNNSTSLQSLTLAAEASLSVDGNLEVKGDISGEAPAAGRVEVRDELVLGGSASHVSLHAGSLKAEAANGSPLVLEDVSVTVASSSISLTQVEVRGDTHFSTTAEGALTLHADNVTFVLDESNSTGVSLQPYAMLMSADPLTETTVAPSVFYIDSSMLAGVNVAGNLTLDLSHWVEEIKAGGYDSIALTFAEGMDFGEETTVQATLNGANFAVADYAGDNMAQFTVANLPTETVPEPTSASLFLLAFSAMASRRRRC